MPGARRGLPACHPPAAGIDPTDPAAIQYLWHKGEDFVKAGSPIPLIFRIATIQDVKPADRVPSRRLWLTAGGASSGQQRQRRGGGGQRQHGSGEGEEGQLDGDQARGRGRRRYKVRGVGRPAGWMHDDRAEEGGEQAGEGAAGGSEGDAEMQRRRRQRRPRAKRRRQGDVDMVDAEDGGGVRAEGLWGGPVQVEGVTLLLRLLWCCGHRGASVRAAR